MVGNQAARSLLADDTAASGLVIRPPDDVYEREAHSVAAAITGGREASSLGRGLSRIRGGLSLKRGVGDGGPAALGGGFGERMARARSEGRPVDREARAALEPRFGVDFSAARVHAGGGAAGLCNELGAEAFTHGRDIFFAAGRYQPKSAAGRGLLAHELTHTIQQRGLTGGPRPRLGGGSSSAVQGLVTRANFEDIAGGERTWGWVKGSKYQTILKAIDAYHAARNDRARSAALDRVILTCNAWIKGHTEDRAEAKKDFRRSIFIKKLLKEASAERSGVAARPGTTVSEMVESRATAGAAVERDAHAARPAGHSYRLLVKALIEHRLYARFAKRRAELTAANKVKAGKWRLDREGLRKRAAREILVEDDPTYDLRTRRLDLRDAIDTLGHAGVGHTWVVFEEVDDDTDTVIDHQSFGFWPGIQLGINPLAARPGAVQHPDSHDSQGGEIRTKTYDLSLPAYQAGLLRCAAIIRRPPDYAISGYNCTAFAQDVTAAAGEELPEAYFTLPNLSRAWNPNTLYDSIGE